MVPQCAQVEPTAGCIKQHSFPSQNGGKSINSYCNNFTLFVRMKLLHCESQLCQTLLRCFDHKQQLRVLTYSFLPLINTDEPRNDVAASCKALLHDVVGNFFSCDCKQSATRQNRSQRREVITSTSAAGDQGTRTELNVRHRHVHCNCVRACPRTSSHPI